MRLNPEPAPSSGWQWPRERRKAGTVLLVAALHLALLVALRSLVAPSAETPGPIADPPALTLLWLRTPTAAPSPLSDVPKPQPKPLSETPPPVPATPTPPRTAPTTPAMPRTTQTAMPPDHASPTPQSAAVAQQPSTAPGPSAHAAAAAPDREASAPLARAPSLLESEATRQAIRQIGKQALLSERAADASGLPLRSESERYQEAAAQAGKGDCLKGEYLGGGAGLLSLPFLALAAARGQCAK